MWPIVTDAQMWSVRLSVCHNHEPCKNCWTDQAAVRAVDSGGPKELCIRWRVKGAVHCKV